MGILISINNKWGVQATWICASIAVSKDQEEEGLMCVTGMEPSGVLGWTGSVCMYV